MVYNESYKSKFERDHGFLGPNYYYIEYNIRLYSFNEGLIVSRMELGLGVMEGSSDH